MNWQDPRYSGYTLDAEEWQRATADVKECIAKVFGDRPSTAEVGQDTLLRVGNGKPAEPCEVNCDGPGSSPAWRRRIEKARREIAEHQSHIEWQARVAEAHRRWSSDDVAGLMEFIERMY